MSAGKQFRTSSPRAQSPLSSFFSIERPRESGGRAPCPYNAPSAEQGSRKCQRSPCACGTASPQHFGSAPAFFRFPCRTAPGVTVKKEPRQGPEPQFVKRPEKAPRPSLGPLPEVPPCILPRPVLHPPASVSAEQSTLVPTCPPRATHTSLLP